MTQATLRGINPKSSYTRFVLSMRFVWALMTLLFASCGGDENIEPKDTLSGTEWTRADGKEVEHLDFTSGTAVDFYYTRDGAVSSMVGSGTYVKNGNNVIFNNLHIAHDFIRIEMVSATINGKNMTVSVKYGSGFDTTETFRQAK